MAAKGRYHLDFAGKHGTWWGTVNALMGVWNAAWLTHVVHVQWPTPQLLTVLFVAALAVAAQGLVLVPAAVKKTRAPSSTVAYRCIWLAGAGAWVVWMVAHESWGWRWLATWTAVLFGAAIFAGLALALAADPPADKARPELPPTPASLAAGVARNKLAAQMEARLNRLTGAQVDPANKDSGWQVIAIQAWERGNGRTYEAIAPRGSSFRSINPVQLGDDLDLPTGCRVEVKMGVSRRVALIEVTEVNMLAQDTDYPADRAPHSINDDLSLSTTDDGTRVGPNMREKCMVIAGETGSGKSNALHVFTSEVVTSTDALDWLWDPTGKAWGAWLAPYLRGEIDEPPIDWVASGEREMLWMARAALRVGTIRPKAYRDLMFEVDDDKVPVSPSLPEIVLVGDEVADVTKVNSDYPEQYETLRRITFETRAGAVRAAFFALRGTDDVMSQSIQSQCHIRGIMRIGSKAEAGWVLNLSNFGPEDTPYPGCGVIRMDSSHGGVVVKWDRMKPSAIKEVAKLAVTRKPKLDEISRLAANGRNPDGSPMEGLMTDELDCYDTRWERYARETGNTPAPKPANPTVPAAAAGGAKVDTATAVANLNESVAAMRAAVEQANADQSNGVTPADGRPLDADERVLFDAIVDGFDFEAAPRAETPPSPQDTEVIMEIITAAGGQGIAPKDLLVELGRREIGMSRDTLYERLKELAGADRIHRPRHGRWAAR